MGMHQFGAPAELVLWLREQFNVSTFIETGTNEGATAVWAAQHFPRVITVEGFEPLYRRVRATYSNITAIDFRLGDSRRELPGIIASLADPAIFWLDAHWCGEHTFGETGECPVLAEIDAVNASLMDHIILIDDARLFLAPPPLPHSADHWPAIHSLCDALDTPAKRRYVMVYNDVVIAVPVTAREPLIDWIRSDAAARPPVSLLRRGLQKIRQSLK